MLLTDYQRSSSSRRRARSISLSDNEFKDLRRRAGIFGLSVSAFIRRELFREGAE